ncbi:sugar phosphate isomerase/epimerase [Pseudonocardia sp. MH-G8]|uniref:sugar phosphate isomerase/epimerase family protein n=1 Tax=Pseudonocardia sp. MH-G8 TaxID=1854588 RepID=UPI000BA0BBB4|nr:sugar phosphate isomerase/epimerase [Pseudonocardia sp. MH-G8]OZM77215.1 sugar phosphate isomerase [Pseudonocardia sp. MH-G8]
MRLGMLTSALPGLPLEELARWAETAGFEALEVAAWPAGATVGGAADHLDPVGFGPGDAERVRALFGRHGLTLSALTYYENPLHPDPVRRAEVHRHLEACIDAAQLLGVAPVGMFVGRDPARTVGENLLLAEEALTPLVERAGELGVPLMVENCPKPDWHPDRLPGNLAYSPELWEWMFDLGLDLNFDPSHLPGVGIDPVAALRPYVDRVRHVQANDVEVFPELRDRVGYLGPVHRADPADAEWWRYRAVGLGGLDWRRLVDVLYEGGFDGVVSVEHEDPVWAGTSQRVQAGLGLAQRALRPLIVEEA